MALVSTFVGIGIAPTLIRAENIATRIVRLTFSERLTVDDALADPTNYTITELGVGDVEVIDVVIEVDGLHVVLTVASDLVPGFLNYSAAGSDAITDLAENPLDETAYLFSVLDFAIGGACAAGQSQLLSQFRDKPGIRGLICALVSRTDEIERALEHIRSYRSLDTAFGVGLDKLGELYGMFRGGRGDDEYRAFLQASALRAGSVGRAEDILHALIILDDGYAPDDIRLIEHFPAALITTGRVDGTSDADLAQLRGESIGFVLRKLKAAGVKILFLFEIDGVTPFVWDDDDTGEGWAEEDDPEGTGGVWMEGV